MHRASPGDEVSHAIVTDVLKLERLSVHVRRVLTNNALRYEILAEAQRAALQLSAYVYETLDGSVKVEPDVKRNGEFVAVPNTPLWLTKLLRRIFGTRTITTQHWRTVHRRVCPHLPIEMDGERTEHLLWLNEGPPC